MAIPARQFLRRRVRHLRPLLWLVIVGLLLEASYHVSRFRVPAPEFELDPPFHTSCQEPNTSAPRENAVLVMLARNEEFLQAQHSVASLERRFNRWFGYPYVFLNDQPFSHEFMDAMRAGTNASTSFEVVPREQWTFPNSLDKDKAQVSIAAQGRHGILYGGLTAYHHMCRFFAG